MLTETSKRKFPYAEGREFGWQLDMEDSSDKPESESSPMEGKPTAVCHKIIIFFIKPSDYNLTGICVCVFTNGRSYLKPWDKYWTWVGSIRRVKVRGLRGYFIDLRKQM